MNKKFFSALIFGALLTLGVAVSAQAQMMGTTERASIPFNFIVSGRTLGAGDYEIKRVGDSPYVLEIRNVHDTHEVTVFTAEPITTPTMDNRSEIVFHRYGDTYFLSSIWDRGEQTGEELTRTRQERRLEREIAANHRVTETVALALY